MHICAFDFANIVKISNINEITIDNFGFCHSYQRIGAE